MPTFSDPSSLIIGSFYLAMLMLVGYAVLCIAAKPGTRHWIEMLGLCFALGAGTTSSLLFFASLAGSVTSRFILIVIAGIAIIAIFGRWKTTGLIAPSVPAPRRKFDATTLLGIAGLVLIAASASNVIAHFSWPGLNDIDAFAIWMFKAKVVSLNAVRPLPLAFTLPNLSYSHQDYPLLLPFLVAGLYAALGHINDEQAKLLLLPIYLSLIAIVYSAIRRLYRRATAIAVTAIFASAPTLTQNAGLLVAETPLILMWAATLALLLRWIETNESSDLVIGLLLGVFTAFIKNEGLALLPVIALFTLILAVRYRKSDGLKKWLISIAPAIVIILPWLSYRSFLPKTHENYGGKLAHPATLLHNLDRTGYIVREFLGTMFSGQNVGLIWYILLLTSILGYRGFTRKSAMVLWIFLLLQLSLYCATFIVTPWDPRELVPMIGPKLLTQASPIAALLIAIHLREIRRKTDPARSRRGFEIILPASGLDTR
jgi:4-amino-4-deoxy-L-arabinose transferase-like glycosyltransferase